MHTTVGTGFLLALSCSLAPTTGSSATIEKTTATPTVTTVSPAQGLMADNSRCFVCHGNYDFDEEKLVFTHAKANIGCVRCHGDSPRHSADEDGLTPPDRMFPKSLIRFNCLFCHDWVKLVANDKVRPDRPDLKEKPDHRAVLDGTAKDKKLCTDCHGDHRLGHRTRRWDKRTGALQYRDATPTMLKQASTPL